MVASLNGATNLSGLVVVGKPRAYETRRAASPITVEVVCAAIVNTQTMEIVKLLK